MTHSGTSNFAVWLLGPLGQRVDLLVNEIGSFNGSHVIGIEEAGSHVLDITASGNWTVGIEQPRVSTAPGIPVTLEGRGEAASNFFTLPAGLVRFEMTHSGQSNFAIWLYRANGTRADLLVNEIGSFNGSKALGVPTSGVFILDITADGPWRISIGQ